MSTLSIGVLKEVSNESALKAISNEAVDYLKSTSICGISYSDTEKMLKFIFQGVKGKESEVLTFPIYRDLIIEKSNADNGSQNQ